MTRCEAFSRAVVLRLSVKSALKSREGLRGRLRLRLRLRLRRGAHRTWSDSIASAVSEIRASQLKASSPGPIFPASVDASAGTRGQRTLLLHIQFPRNRGGELAVCETRKGTKTRAPQTGGGRRHILLVRVFLLTTTAFPQPQPQIQRVTCRSGRRRRSRRRRPRISSRSSTRRAELGFGGKRERMRCGGELAPVVCVELEFEEGCRPVEAEWEF